MSCTCRNVTFVDKREAALGVGVAVVREREADGVFGPRTDQRFVVICLSGPRGAIMMESAQLINTPNSDRLGAHAS